MMRRKTALTGAFFGIHAFVPLSLLITGITGFTVEIRHHTAVAAAMLVLSAVLTVILLWDRSSPTVNAELLAALALPVAEIGWLLHSFMSTDATVSGLVMCGALCAVPVLIRVAKKMWMIALSAVVSFFAFIPMLFLIFFILIFGDIGVNTVVYSVDSPSGRYTAEVIDSDQGALGGDTLVDVRDHEFEVDLYFVRFCKRPERVYKGKWGEFGDMELWWADDGTLVVDGREYVVG